MTKKTMILYGLLIWLTSAPLSANSPFSLNAGNLFKTGSAELSPITDGISYSVKKGQRYSEADDPQFHTNGPATTTPMHGYFPVSALFIGFAGILIYFWKND